MTRPSSILALLLPLAACQHNGFVRVTVKEIDAGSVFPPVFQLRSLASDSDAGPPNSALGPPETNQIGFPKTLVVEVPSNVTTLTEVVEGLDANGNTVLRGSNATAFSAGAQASLTVILTQACNSSLDCDPAAFCAGQLFCTASGACVANSPTAPPAFGTACGDDGGRCDFQLSCVPAFGSCGDGIQGSYPLPDGGFFQVQCDWGSGADGGVCTGPNGTCNSLQPNACRPNCLLPSCGDGVIDNGERCDQGSGPKGNGTLHGCNATCTLIGTATRIVGNGDQMNGVPCNPSSCNTDGPGAVAEFQNIAGIAVVGRTLYVADQLNELIRAVDLTSPNYDVTTLAGDAGPVSAAQGGGTCATTQDGTGNGACFYLPYQPLGYQGALLVGTGSSLRQISLPGGVVTTLAGPNTGNRRADNPFGTVVPLDAGPFDTISGLAADPATGVIYAVEQGAGYIRKIDPAANSVSYVAGGGQLTGPTSVVFFDGGLLVSATGSEYILHISFGGDAGTGAGTVDVAAGNGGQTFADGTAQLAGFNGPSGMCTDGQTIYIADRLNRAIRQMDPVSYQVTTLIGGPNADAGIFDAPYDCAWDPDAGVLYVSDQSKTAASSDGVGNVIYKVQ